MSKIADAVNAVRKHITEIEIAADVRYPDTIPISECFLYLEAATMALATLKSELHYQNREQLGSKTAIEECLRRRAVESIVSLAMAIPHYVPTPVLVTRHREKVEQRERFELYDF